MGDRGSRRLHLLSAAAVVLAAAMAYLAARSVLSTDGEVDFRFVWLAGRLWAAGLDPYGPHFSAVGHRLFPFGSTVDFWLYPPQWWIICRPLGALPTASALVAWRCLNAVLILVAAALPAQALRSAGRPTPAWAVMLGVAYALLMQATPVTLAMGQTSILILFGAALVVRALLTGDERAMVAGMVIAVLKPHVGIVLAAGLLPQPRWWRSLAIAGAISLAMCVPHVLQFGAGATVRGFLHNLGEHASIVTNTPENLTGLTQIAWLAGVHVSTGQATALGAVAAFLAAIRLRRCEPGAPARAIVPVVLCCFVLPLHDYDMVLAAPVAVLLIATRGSALALLLAGMALLFRPANLARLFGPETPLPSAATSHELAIVAFGTLLLAAGAIVLLAGPLAANRRGREAGPS